MGNLHGVALETAAVSCGLSANVVTRRPAPASSSMGSSSSAGVTFAPESRGRSHASRGG